MSQSALHRTISLGSLASNVSNLSNAPHLFNNDKYIKLLLKQFKKLELGLNKFNAKNNGVLTTNILRTKLLPFLRSNLFKQILVKPTNSKIYKSLSSILLTLLSKWWSSLLNYLINSNNISSIDKSAYFECISKIMARIEWFHIKDDDSLSCNYKELLILTLDYCINRLSCIKHLTLSMAAFVGKVFAYSFFKIDNVSNALLFLLNIKQAVFEENNKNFESTSANENLEKLYSVFPAHTHYLINYQGLPNRKSLSDKQRMYLNCLLPPKHPVQGIKDPNGPWVRRWFNSDSDIFNSFLRHYCTISNVYLSLNQVDVNNDLLLKLPGFNIILSHIFQIFQVSINRISKNNASLKFNQEFQVNTINNNRSNSFNGSNSVSSNNSSNGSAKDSMKQNEVYYNSIFKIFRTLRDINYQSDFQFSKNLIEFVDSILINFAKTITIYDFNKSSLILNLVYEFLAYLETVDWGFWLNCCYLMISNTDHVQVLLKNLSFLFNVWNRIPEMVESDTRVDENQLVWYTNKEESFKENFIDWLISNEVWSKLFIHWNPIVRNYYIRLLIWRVIGINNFESSTSIKVSLKIENKLGQSFETFSQLYKNARDQEYYFKPDNPIINKKFLILPVSKDDLLVTDVNTVPVSTSSLLDSKISGVKGGEVSSEATGQDGVENDNNDNDTSNEDISSKTDRSSNSGGSNSNDNEDISTLINASELKKAHPFEIFDETIYSCSTVVEEQNTSNEDTEGKRSNSLVSSIGKLFKSLTFEDKEKGKGNQREKTKKSSNSIFSNNGTGSSGSPGAGHNSTSRLTKISKSGSLTSLSNNSVKSRSSSPSIMSFNSTPTSLTDLSNSTSSSSSSKSKTVNPMELFNLPPEIVRPLYKFDLTLDQDSIRDKLYLMNQRKYRSYRDFYELPEKPRIPSITIFISSNIYNRFYISTDNLIWNDEDYKNTDFELGLFKDLHKTIDFINLGKSLFEWNLLIMEFESYLTNQVELHQDLNNLNEHDYFNRIIPLLSLDNSSSKSLNAA